MKKIVISLLTVAAMLVSFSGCGGNNPQNSSSANSSDKNKRTGKETVVYMTKDISPEGLVKVYQALNWTPTGKVGVKLHTGEPPASNYLDPNLIKDLISSVNGTIVECNTAYGGQRDTTVMHKQIAKDHGFTAIADFDIMDEEGSMSLPVTNGKYLKEDLVGTHFKNYDSYIVLSHFKGHQMAGFGGALKNASIGFASREGKFYIHSHGESKTSIRYDQDPFLESMGEAAKAVSDYLDGGKRVVYINVMNKLSIDCDCNGHPAEPKMADIGILASTDPVALDQACVDLVFEQKDGDGKDLCNRISGLNGVHILENAEKIGLGSRNCKIVSIDK